eukprot:SAG31_NODE_43142_length_268_cov_0.869822_1_plen_23_part_01
MEKQETSHKNEKATILTFFAKYA